MAVYPLIVPVGAVKLIVTELDVALTNVRPVGGVALTTAVIATTELVVPPIVPLDNAKLLVP